MKNETVSINDKFYFSSVSRNFYILRYTAGRGEGGRVISSEPHGGHCFLVVMSFDYLITCDPTLYEQIYLQDTGVIIQCTREDTMHGFCVSFICCVSSLYCKPLTPQTKGRGYSYVGGTIMMRCNRDTLFLLND